jgi:diadenylate cyclase
MEEALRALSVRGIHWFDILDIIAVCVLFFFVLRQVRGTRAVQMIVGVFVLLVANVASGWFQLTATHRLLQNILFYVPFAIIVLFQESIRKFLASLGSLFFGRSASIAMSQEIASETAHACFALAELKHGALIIFERTQGLKNYADTGVVVDAAWNSDTLKTIFYPGTPLHDGAVIVAEGTIQAARCFLPISSSPLPTQYGTRHRAAVGVTEETDAVCVVVSEERGAVSVVVEGIIERVSTIEELTSKLARLFGGKAGESAA